MAVIYKGLIDALQYFLLGVGYKNVELSEYAPKLSLGLAYRIRGAQSDALAMCIRPTGITHDNRQDTVQTVLRETVDQRYVPRFSLEAKRHGVGSGGIEVHTHLHAPVTTKPKSKLSLVIQDLWDEEDLDYSTEVGELGFIPKDLAKPIRKLIYEHPYCIPLYQTCQGTEAIKSLSFVLLVWNVDKALLDHLDKDLTVGYETTAMFTNLQRWRPDRFKAAKYILSGTPKSK